MLSMQCIVFPGILWIGGITTQFPDEAAETLRLTVLTEVTEPGLSDIRAHAFSRSVTRATPHSPPPPLPLAREAGALPKGWVGGVLPKGLSES